MINYIRQKGFKKNSALVAILSLILSICNISFILQYLDIYILKFYSNTYFAPYSGRQNYFNTWVSLNKGRLFNEKLHRPCLSPGPLTYDLTGGHLICNKRLRQLKELTTQPWLGGLYTKHSYVTSLPLLACLTKEQNYYLALLVLRILHHLGDEFQSVFLGLIV